MGLLDGNGFWVYVLIFLGKIIEVTLSTIRIVLINRGEKKVGSLIAFVEVVLWIYIASAVIMGIRDDIYKALAYSVAFAVGNYIGSWLEGKLALGLCTIQVITADDEKSQELISNLREKKLAVTVLDGEGMDGNKKVLLIHTKRNKIKEVTNYINQMGIVNVITISDLKQIKGGFIKK